jgi:hypothetical protein
MNNKEKKIEIFLNRASSQKEPVFVIAQNNQEAKEFQDIIEGAGFKQAKTVRDLMKKIKSVNRKFLLISQGDNLKDIYDFVVQYPTGQVEIYDKKSLTTEVLNPDYKNASFVFLITKEDIKNSKENGYDFMSFAGLTYQV